MYKRKIRTMISPSWKMPLHLPLSKRAAENRSGISGAICGSYNL
ncbi:hypothetical protein Plhal304r1_c047g0128261 [Plasmopara halstedii]